MKTMNQWEWWNSLSPTVIKAYRESVSRYWATNEEVKQWYEKDYLNKPEFTAGQQVWVDDIPATYMFPNKNPGVRPNSHYVVLAAGYIANEQVISKQINQISATKPKPPIKKGTPILCWTKDSEKYIRLFVKWTDDGKALCSVCPNEKLTSSWENCEVYSF